MKKLILFILLSVMLVSCGAKADVIVDHETYETFVSFKPDESTSSGAVNIIFNGYVFQTFDGKWIISFSEISHSAVNTTYIVQEGDIITYKNKKMEIIKLEPNENKIVVKFE